MADKENIKNIIDEQLNNVHVTDELKSKTLKKCRMSNCSNKKNIFNKKFNIAIAAVLVFIVFLGSYFVNLVKSREDKYAQRTNSNNENTSIAQLDSLNDDSKNCIEKKLQNDEYNKKNEDDEDNKKDKDKIIQNEIESDKNKTTNKINNKIKTEKSPIINKKTDVKIAKKENVKDVVQNQDKEVIKQEDVSNSEKGEKENELHLKIKNVEKSWGGKIDLPEYVPKGYKMYDLVACNDKDKKAIKIIYKNEDSYFEIKQMKEPVNGTILAVIEGKQHQSNGKNDNKANNNNKDKTLDVDTVKNGIYYNVKGSVSKEILEKVMDSIN